MFQGTPLFNFFSPTRAWTSVRKILEIWRSGWKYPCKILNFDFKILELVFKMPKEVFRILLFASTWTDTKIDGVTLFLRKIVDRIIFCYLLNETIFFQRFDLLDGNLPWQQLRREFEPVYLTDQSAIWKVPYTLEQTNPLPKPTQFHFHPSRNHTKQIYSTLLLTFNTGPWVML